MPFSRNDRYAFENVRSGVTKRELTRFNGSKCRVRYNAILSLLPEVTSI